MTTEQEQAVQKVLRALRDKGPWPKEHDRVAKEFRAAWPTLARALDELERCHPRS